MEIVKSRIFFIINDLRLIHVNKSRINISLCHMQPLPMVRQIIDVEVELLDMEFVDDYCKGDGVLYS